MKSNLENGYIEFNGNRVELTKEQMEVLFGKDNPYEYKEDEDYYYTDPDFSVGTSSCWLSMYNNGNYCRNEKLKIQDTLHDLLRSKLRQFSMLNGGLDIDWNDDSTNKYYIYYNVNDREYCVNPNLTIKNQSIYFINEKTARRAINEVIIPFEKKHPEFVW